MAGRSQIIRIKKFAGIFCYAIQTFILRRVRPYLFLLVINDTCNLNCFYCVSKNSGRYDLDYDSAVKLIEKAYQRGHRILGLTGGEPMLWESDGATLRDIVRKAISIGFFDVSVATNGTFPLGIQECRYVVTIDGTRDIHETVRPGTYDLILQNVRESKGDVVASITISKANAPYLEDIVKSIAATGLFKAISFNLLTHNSEIVAKHGLCGQDRKAALDRIWDLKRRGFPILLSQAAYEALRSNDWKRPVKQIELGTRDQVFTCCRDVGNPDICKNCGYTSCVEISQLLEAKRSAVMEMIRLMK